MKSITLSLLAFTMMSTATIAQTGDEIITRHIAAIGGEANWNKITSIKRTGALTIQGMEISMTNTIVHNKGLRMDISAMGMDGYVILTPTAGWMYMPMQPGMDKVTPMPEDQVKLAQDQLNIKRSLLADKSLITKAVFTGRDTLDSIPCLKVLVSGKDGTEQTAYFDAKTYYMIRTEGKIKAKDEEAEVAMSFSNFQKQPQGITIAMTENNPQYGGEVVYKSVEINQPVSDDTFKPTEPKPEEGAK
jgi:outer membrane lipoprotein-sorting protein